MMKKEDLYKLALPLAGVREWLCGKTGSPALAHDTIDGCATSVQKLAFLSGLNTDTNTERLWAMLSDVTLLMGRLAHRLASASLAEAIALRSACLDARENPLRFGRASEDVEAFATRLAMCLKHLSAEREFLDPAEFAATCPEPCAKSLGEDGDFRDKAKNLARVFKAWTKAFKSTTPPKALPVLDTREAQDVLGAETWRHVNEDAHVANLAATPSTGMQQDAWNALARSLDAAWKQAKSLGSPALADLSDVRKTFAERKRAFFQNPDDIATAGILEDFLVQLERAYGHLWRDLVAAKKAAEEKKASKPRTRRLSGLKGTKTERMSEQLKRFIKFMQGKDANQVLKYASQFILQAKENADKATSNGKKPTRERGYTNYKSLATAYKNEMKKREEP